MGTKKLRPARIRDGQMGKKILMTAVMIMFAAVSMAQDMIVLSNGNVIKAKVVKIDGNAVRYRNYADSTGAVLTIFTPDILSITYENGTVQSFSVTTPTQAPASSTQSTPSGNDTWKQMERSRLLAAAKSWDNVGDVLYWVGALGGLGVGVYLGINGVSSWWIVWVSAWGSGALWMIICGAVSSGLERQANALAYSPLIKYDWQFEHGSLTTSLGSFAMSSPSLPGNGLTGSVSGFGAGLNFRF